MNKYYLLNRNDDSLLEFISKTPREAALKAASRNISLIILVDKNKLHLFRGSRKPLEEHEHTEFTTAKNIRSKPNVVKLVTTKLDYKVDIRIEKDLEYIKDILNEYMF